jgi:glycosyltransferase involved in cell wall biosynthesis
MNYLLPSRPETIILRAVSQLKRPAELPAPRNSFHEPNEEQGITVQRKDALQKRIAWKFMSAKVHHARGLGPDALNARPKKLLQLISSMDPVAGGPCQGIRNLKPRLSDQGHTVEVVCLDDPNSSYLACETLPIQALGPGKGPWCYHSALRPWLKKNLPRFDAVILNGLWQFPGFVLSRLAGCQNAPPYYVFPHGMLDPWFQLARGRRLKAIRNWFYWKLVEQQVIHRAEALLFTSAEEMRLARDTFRPYQPKREINVGFGVSEPLERTPALQLAFEQRCRGLGGRSYLLFLGRIDPKKGVDILIQAFAAVYGSKFDPQKPSTCLVIAGPGMDGKFGRKMFELAHQTCPPGSVLFPGMLMGEAKWGALYGAEACVLLSHQENFGLAVVESLSCGTPVLISNQVNIWREIQQDEAGLVEGDTLSGAEQLLRRWQSRLPEENIKMRRAAQDSYGNRFGIALAAQNLLKVLEEPAARPRVESVFDSFAPG